jgi:hypothetical protein
MRPGSHGNDGVEGDRGGVGAHATILHYVEMFTFSFFNNISHQVLSLCELSHQHCTDNYHHSSLNSYCCSGKAPL